MTITHVECRFWSLSLWPWWSTIIRTLDIGIDTWMVLIRRVVIVLYTRKCISEIYVNRLGRSKAWKLALIGGHKSNYLLIGFLQIVLSLLVFRPNARGRTYTGIWDIVSGTKVLVFRQKCNINAVRHQHKFSPTHAKGVEKWRNANFIG